MKPKCLSKGQRLDIITTLPQAIIETILCLLPIEEATRTSILSREWRYKWTTIPKLKFLYSTVKISGKDIDGKQLSSLEVSRDEDRNRKLINAIHQVLLMRQGPIHEFSLSIETKLTFEVDQIILSLSRNHAVKILTLDLQDPLLRSLPLSVFLLHHLTELHLNSCDFDHQPTYSGFGSLTRLSLDWVGMSRETLLHLLSNCPSLKRLRWMMLNEHFHNEKFPNIVELFKCLPVIERLTTWGYIFPWIIPDSVPQELPTPLIHLKYLSIEQLGFADGYAFAFLGIMIKSSPNLEKIKIEVFEDDYYEEVEPDELEEFSDILKGYSDVRLEHLNELKFKGFRNFKLEMDFVKFILARSPNLKKVILQVDMHNKYRELEMTKVLLRAPRVSPVEIIVDNRG